VVKKLTIIGVAGGRFCCAGEFLNMLDQSVVTQPAAAESECGIKAAVEDDQISARRHKSYLRLKG